MYVCMYFSHLSYSKLSWSILLTLYSIVFCTCITISFISDLIKSIFRSYSSRSLYYSVSRLTVLVALRDLPVLPILCNLVWLFDIIIGLPFTFKCGNLELLIFWSSSNFLRLFFDPGLFALSLCSLSNHKLWITRKIESLMNYRDKTHKLSRGSNILEPTQRFKQLCFIASNKVHTSKIQHISGLLSEPLKYHYLNTRTFSPSFRNFSIIKLIINSEPF